jgi:hypothetical protein
MGRRQEGPGPIRRWLYRTDRIGEWASAGVVAGLGLWGVGAGVAGGRWTLVLVGLGFCGGAVLAYLSRLRPIPTTQTHTLKEVRRTHTRHFVGFVVCLAAIFGGVALAKMGFG